jgi:hypothetical protein
MQSLFQNSLSLHFSPLLSGAALYGLIIAALLIVVLCAWQQRRIPLLRLLIFAAFTLVLLNPSVREEKREALRNVALVIVDQSASQNIGERTAQTQKALTYLKTAIEPLDSVELRTSEGPENGEFATSTPLYSLMKKKLEDVPPALRAGVIFITDGQIHDLPAALDNLEDFGPVHTLLTGERDEKDRRIEITEAPAFGIVGEKISVKYTVQDHGAITDNSARVTLKMAGQPEEIFIVPTGEEQTITLPIDHAGQNIFELSTQALDGELTLINNRAAIELQGIRDRLRVLLVSGRPHAGGRTWRDLLTSDPGVDLVHFTILRDPEKVDSTPSSEMSLIAFPFRELFEVKLYEFDLIVFDRYTLNRVLPDEYFANIVKFVQDGGAFLESSGPEYAGRMSLYDSPLKPILPGVPTGEIITKSFVPTITAIGQSHPVTQGLSAPDQAAGVPAWGPWLRQIAVRAVDSDVVMKGYNNAPLLMLRRVGKGRVAQIASDQIWLWSRGYQAGGPHAELLRRTLHWSMKEPALDERALRIAVNNRTLTIERPAYQKTSPDVEMITPGGVSSNIVLDTIDDHTLRAIVQAEQNGIYEFRTKDDQQSRFAIVGDIDTAEFRDVLSSDKIMRPLAKKTGGAVIRLSDQERPTIKLSHNPRNSGGSDAITLRNNKNYQITGAQEKPLLPFWLGAFLLTALITACWWFEGKKNA